MKKKVLYFMPDNPFEGFTGSRTRVNYMLNYFEKNNKYLDVSYLGLRDWGVWNEVSIDKFHRCYPNIKLNFLSRKLTGKGFLKNIFGYKIPNFLMKMKRGTSVDITSVVMQSMFTKLVNENKYDIIIISYTRWGKLSEHNMNHNPYFIIDTHDFITAQNRNNKKIGELFQSEIDILRRFNEIWTYSIEEKYIFEQFTDQKVTLMPVAFPENYNKHTRSFKYDIIYVASKNNHNITGVKWFLEKVLPILKSDIKIHIIGNICEVIGDDPNVIKHGMVDNLEEFYQNARIVICPMFSGTGVKIKVLEALSYGIPVVTNQRGVDGLLNKFANGCLVTENEVEFASYILKLIDNNDFYISKSKEAENYFSAHHTPDKEIKILDAIFLK